MTTIAYNGSPLTTRFQTFGGVAADNAGHVYLSISNTIEEMTLNGSNWMVETIAGLAGISGSANGTNDAARFNVPEGLAVDSAGNIYVADNNNCMIRKITLLGSNWVVSTIAGAARIAGNGDGTGTNALFAYPEGLAVDSAGNIYVADTGNNTVRRVTSLGVVWTLAGRSVSAGSADGPGIAAQFNQPAAIAQDAAGNLYVTDAGNCTIRQINPSGQVNTLAGMAGNPGSSDGVGSYALFAFPEGLAVDCAGNIYVADTGNETIRKITPAGLVSTIAGQVMQYGWLRRRHWNQRLVCFARRPPWMPREISM